MKRHSSTLVLVSCVALFGCGSTGGGTPLLPQGATMQAGQWEFVATPSSGAPPVYIESNLTLAPDQVTSGVLNTVLFEFGGTGLGGVGTTCGNWSLDSTVANGVLGGPIPAGSSGGAISSPSSGVIEASFSATIANNGQSVSGGSYTDNGSFCGFESAKTSGTFNGSAITPLNGTFSGTLTGNGQPQLVTLQIVQNSTFGLTVSGTSVQSGVTTSIAISPAGPSLFSNVIGATIDASGTTSNINGSNTIQMSGHFNSSGTQVALAIDIAGLAASGTLTKQ
jgi:hypothetical protein